MLRVVVVNLNLVDGSLDPAHRGILLEGPRGQRHEQAQEHTDGRGSELEREPQHPPDAPPERPHELEELVDLVQVLLAGDPPERFALAGSVGAGEGAGQRRRPVFFFLKVVAVVAVLVAVLAALPDGQGLAFVVARRVAGDEV